VHVWCGDVDAACGASDCVYFEVGGNHNLAALASCVCKAPDGAFCWTFAPAGIEVSSDTFGSKTEALADLMAVRRQLHTVWHDVSKREAHLRRVQEVRNQSQKLESIAQRVILRFARNSLLSKISVGVGAESSTLGRGFPNLGNTCYINAVVQCLFHCAPFRQDLERQVHEVARKVKSWPVCDCWQDWQSYVELSACLVVFHRQWPSQHFV
jgi:hypothetical protein